MIAGNPDTFAIITEKVANWRTDGRVSGMLHVCINGVAYPRKPRATDVENDILCLDLSFLVSQDRYLEDGIHFNYTFYEGWIGLLAEAVSAS